MVQPPQHVYLLQILSQIIVRVNTCSRCALSKDTMLVSPEPGMPGVKTYESQNLQQPLRCAVIAHAITVTSCMFQPEYSLAHLCHVLIHSEQRGSYLEATST